MCAAAYAAKKAELAEERKRREAEREAAREARRQAMRDYMEHNFLQVPPLVASALNSNLHTNIGFGLAFLHVVDFSSSVH